MLETSIGSAASAHVFATLGGQHYNCELFGPQLLVDDIVTERMAIRDFELQLPDGPDRKSTRLNSSHLVISYAVFCLKKKKKTSLASASMSKAHGPDHVMPARSRE